MQNLFRAISIYYKTAPIAIREQIALTHTQAQSLIEELQTLDNIGDILVVSTCNRTEVYYTSPTAHTEAILQMLDAEKYKDHFKVLENKEAIEHLFRVSLGLESQVVGDLQIINQIKQAYQLSADTNVAGPFLHRLLHTIFFANKRLVQETTFRSGAASTSYACVELIQDLAYALTNPRILVVGLGEIGADVCRNLKETHLPFSITNRTLSKAEALATECNATVIPFENLPTAIENADIIISAVTAEKPLLTPDLFPLQNALSFQYVIDLAVPRSVSPDLENVASVVTYNIDQINNKVNAALQKRLDAIPQVEAIIAQAMNELQEWAQEMEISPTLQKLKNALEQIRQEEIARFQKKMSDSEAEKIEQITRNMMQKIIKLPALQLKAACKRGEAETLIDVLNDLFNLEREVVK
jgi:glutamyl-tRNA reductase